MKQNLSCFSGIETDEIVERCVKSGLGVVIIGLQQTRLDGECSLRVFGEIDQILMKLSEMMKLKHRTPEASDKMLQHALIPFDKDGDRSRRYFSCLDLSR